MDSGAKAVVCLSKFREKVQRCMPLGKSAEVLELDASDSIWRNGDTQRPSLEDVNPGDGAYVIYTSGTTGKPKGVDCSHENVCNNLLNEPAKLGITVGTNVACVLMLAFDMCAWEILATLMNGGTLNLRGSGRPGGDSDVWNACLRRVDVVISTPTGAQKYFPRRSDFPNLKTVVVGGEPCPLALAEEWTAPPSQARFINICGPTEITILNTAQIHQHNTPLTIGKPLPNTNVYVLDDNLAPVRIGEIGLMWVGGLSVSRGYVNLPNLTAQRYQPDKFTMDGRMMFNTGDLGRWTGDGELEHFGRKDDQVKIKGFRVELDGVSACMESFAGVKKACALKLGEKLVGFYSSGEVVQQTALAAHLATQLNHYACPGQLVHVGSSMPMTPGGKIDKKALAEGLPLSSASSAVTVTVPVPTTSSSSSSSSVLSEKTVTVVDVERGVKSISDTTSIESIEELPEKNGFHGQRWLRHKGLNAYKKLFIFIFLINLVVFIAMVAATPGGLPVDKVATAVAANLVTSVLFRQDLVVNFVFWFSTLLPTSTPLSIRRHFARCYHMGGLHSGAAITATLWWIVFAAQSTIYFVQGDATYQVNSATIGLTFVILAFLTLILGMAYPSVRVKLHDQFEWTHRFAGWTTLGLFWAHIIVSTASLNQAAGLTLGEAVAQNPAVWLLLVATLSVALPWMRLRKVNVVPEPLSNHAIRLHFDFCHPTPGRAVRITDSPMREWHAFATIAEPDKPGFSIVVSRAGDWTGRIIENPPTRIWTRGVPASGVLRMATLFHKVVLVATGSGIGPCLPVIFAGKVPCRVFWSTPNPEKTFGKKIIDGILAQDPEAVIWNTRERGRPNMALEAYKLYKSSGAECVCVISNGPVTSKLVYDLEARGVPAFGPIFDS